jgi:SPX domain protein involved in polyphosphate accumulation
MLHIPVNSRHEIKFVANFYTLPKLLVWIKCNKLAFYKEYADREVNNIYFDTYEYFSYASNLSGQSSRQKVRYRWYGDQSLDLGQLEIKNKRNNLGWKDTYKVMQKPYKIGDSWRQVIQSISSELPDKAKPILKLYSFPVISNKYSRSYFISQDKKIRITIDTDQKTYDQRYKSFPNFKVKSNLLDTFVLEVKFDKVERDRVTDFLTGLPIRASRHSKYMNSVNSVSGRGYF